MAERDTSVILPTTLALYEELSNTFALTYVRDDPSPHELLFRLPVQPGLDFELELFLIRRPGSRGFAEILGLRTGAFEMSENYFTRGADTIDYFRGLLTALLAGHGRIIQRTYKMTRGVEYQVQTYDGRGWLTQYASASGTGFDAVLVKAVPAARSVLTRDRVVAINSAVSQS